LPAAGSCARLPHRELRKHVTEKLDGALVELDGEHIGVAVHQYLGQGAGARPQLNDTGSARLGGDAQSLITAHFVLALPEAVANLEDVVLVAQVVLAQRLFWFEGDLWGLSINALCG